MIAEWTRDTLSRVVARCMGRKLWQTVTFLANVAGQMARWLAKLQFDCSKRPPHSERFSLSRNFSKIRCTIAKSCSSLHLRSSTYVNHKKFMAAWKIQQLEPANVRVSVQHFILDFILAKRCYSQQLHREFATRPRPPKASSAGQSYGNSPMSVLKLNASMLGKGQLRSRHTSNNTVLEKIDIMPW